MKLKGATLKQTGSTTAPPEMHVTFQKNLQLLRIADAKLFQCVNDHYDSTPLTIESLQGTKGYSATFHDGHTISREGDQSTWLEIADQSVTVNINTELVPLIIGVENGEVILAIARKTDEPFYEFPEAFISLYIVEERVDHFILFMHLFDLREILFSQRVNFAVGPEWEAMLRAHLKRGNTRKPTKIFSTQGGESAVAYTRSVIERIGSEIDQEARQLQAELHDYYAENSYEVWQTQSSLMNADRPLRVLGIVSVFSSFIKYCMQDLLQGVRDLGHETELLIENDRGFNAFNAFKQLKSFKPDLIIIIDHMRWEWKGVFPPGLPVVSWIQDLLPNLTQADDKRLLKEDIVFSFAKAWLEDGSLSGPMFQESNKEAHFLPIGFNHHVIQPRSDVEKDLDVVVVSHLCDPGENCNCIRAGETMRLYIPEKHLLEADRVTVSQLLRLYQVFMETLDGFSSFDLTRIQFETGALDDLGRDLLQRVNLPTDPDYLDLFNGYCSRVIWEIITRIKARPVEHLVKAGVDLHVYGKNWSQISGIDSAIRGQIAFGDELNRLTNRAKIALNAPGTTFHMRSLEIIGSRTFMLSRDLPHAFDLTSLTDFFERDSEVILYRDGMDLVEKVHYYLDNPEQRERIAERAYRKSLDQFTYPKVAERMINVVSEELTGHSST
ncbi:MAG: glycosyltransferase family 1 protein [Magnetococcales bacterium]|nr:glycosyltransferase family 1 protein [Magnetococcales bacterium]